MKMENTLALWEFMWSRKSAWNLQIYCSSLTTMLEVSSAVCMCVCVWYICWWRLNHIVRGWGVTQKVLPKQAPEAVETDRRKTTYKSVKRQKGKKEKKKAESGSAELTQSYKCSSVTKLQSETHLKQHKHLDGQSIQCNRQTIADKCLKLFHNKRKSDVSKQLETKTQE